MAFLSGWIEVLKMNCIELPKNIKNKGLSRFCGPLARHSHVIENGFMRGGRAQGHCIDKQSDVNPSKGE